MLEALYLSRYFPSRATPVLSIPAKLFCRGSHPRSIDEQIMVGVRRISALRGPPPGERGARAKERPSNQFVMNPRSAHVRPARTRISHSALSQTWPRSIITTIARLFLLYLAEDFRVKLPTTGAIIYNRFFHHKATSLF